MPKKKSRKPHRVQADKNYIEVMGKIFVVLEYLVERGGTQKEVPFADISAAVPWQPERPHC